jgi:hypothetical protein
VKLEYKPVKAATLEDLSPEAAMLIAREVKQNYDDWRNIRSGLEEQWADIDRQINQYDPVHTAAHKAEQNMTMTGPGLMGSKLKMANTFSHREGIVAAHLKYLMLDGYDFFDVAPMDAADAEACDAVKQYLLYLFDTMDFQTAYTPFLRSLATYGTAIASYEWVEESTVRWKKQVIDDGTGNKISYMEQAYDLIYNAPKFDTLNLYRAVLDPSAKDVKKAKLIFEKILTPHEIMANTAYHNLDESWVFQQTDVSADKDSVPDSTRFEAQTGTTTDTNTMYRGKKLVYEAWGDFADDKVLYQNYVAEVMNGVLIRFEPNPYNIPHKPFVVARYTTEPNQIYGKSPLASVTGMQQAYDTILNQIIDANAMHNERPILITRDALIQQRMNKNELPPLGKNYAWLVSDIKASVGRMSDPDYQGVIQSMNVLPLIEQQMKLATGDNELMSGGAGINDQYATTGHVVTVAEAGNARFNMYSKTAENESIIPVLNMTVDFLRQRISDIAPKTFSANNSSANDAIQFEPTMLLNNIKFTMRGASYNATKQLQINARQQFYQMVAGNQFTAPLMNWVRVIIDFGEAIGIRSIRSQLSPQANQIAAQTPPAPSWWQRAVGLLQNNQQKQAEETSIGQQFTNSMAGGFGGATPNSGATSPFNPNPQ